MLKRVPKLIAVIAVVLFLLVPLAAWAQTAAAPSLLVKLVSGLTAQEIAEVIARHGGTEVGAIPALELHVIAVAPEALEAVRAGYASDPRVVRVEVQKTRRVQAGPTDPLYPQQWYLAKIGWEQLFGTVGAAGTATVAILDTGVDGRHPDLVGKLVSGASVFDDSDGTTDAAGHGTRLAGIVAAQTNNLEGIAGVGYAGVRILPVTVLDADGHGQDSDIIAGILWAADQGADVILMAFSNPGYSPSLQDAIDYAWAKGVVLVAAAGNEGTSEATFPAGHRGVLGVGATDETDALAPWSNTGPGVFLAAPGTNIVTTEVGDAYTVVSGTSTSAAIVAGSAALLKAVDPTLSNGVLVGRLARTTDAAGTTGELGNGRLNLGRAAADTSSNPVIPAGVAGGGGPFVGPYVAQAGVRILATDVSSDPGFAFQTEVALAGQPIYARATSATASRGYKLELFNQAGVSVYLGPCRTGSTTISGDSFTPTTISGTAAQQWKWQVYEWANSNCTGALTPADTDDSQTFSVAKVMAYTDATLSTPATSYSGSNSAAYIVIDGFVPNHTDANVSWIKPDGSVACTNLAGVDRPDSSTSGRLPGAAGSFLQFPPNATATGDPWNQNAQYETSCLVAGSSFASNPGTWTIKVTPKDQPTRGFTADVFTVDLPTVKLDFGAINGGASPFVGLPFSVVVQSQEAGGTPRPVTADTAVTLGLGSGTGALGGTLTGTIPAGQSAVTIAGVVYNTAESGVTMTVTRTSGDALTGTTSASFSVVSTALLGTATVTPDAVTTASVSLTQSTLANEAVLILIYRQAKAVPDSVTSITGPFTGTPVLIQSATFQTNYNVWVYLAKGNGGGGNVSVTFAQPNRQTVIDVVQLAEANQANPIVQSAANWSSTSTSSASVTLPAPASAANAQLMFVGLDADRAVTATSPAGFGVLNQTRGTNSGGFGTWTAFRTSAATTVVTTLSGMSAWGAISLEVNMDRPRTTTTTLASTNNPSTSGASVTFTATVTAPHGSPGANGTVTFRKGATALCAEVALDASSQAACTTSTLAVGAHSVTAEYSGATAGETTWSGSTSSTLSQTVAQASQAITVTQSAPANAVYNASFTVTATGGGSGQPVVIAGAGACAGAGNGSATLTMTSGTGVCTVTYNQADTANYSAAPQVTEATAAQKATQAITVTQSAPATANHNAAFGVAATGGASGQPVVIAGAGACTGGGNGSATLTMTSGTGACTVTYTQAGDGNYSAAPQVAQTTSAQKLAQAILFGALADRPYGSADFAVSATGGASGQPVTFTAAGACTVTGALVHLASVGSCTITAHQAGDANYSAAGDVARTFEVTANTPPQTTITGGPAGPTSSTTATFAFAGTDDVTAPANLVFECKLDGGPFAACTSPATYTGLGAGAHTFSVRAIDGAGNVDPTPATFSWGIVSTAPAVIFDGLPFDGTDRTTATFVFHATDGAITFQCSLDGEPFVACTSPASYSGLGDGSHTFVVRAIDQAGNPGPESSFTWTVDSQAPGTLIDTAPSAITRSNTATFGFHGLQGTTFTCQLDGGPAEPCSAPVTYTGLAPGVHAFTVTPTDAGGVEGAPVTFQWVIDVAAPETVIGTGPVEGSTTTSTSATFTMSGTDDVSDAGDLTFECSLDGATFGPCGSPVTYTNLSRGPHTFAVRATDQAGNVNGSPATRSWTVTKRTPVIAWSDPSGILYPAPLGGTQLNATADVPGTFVYTPASGTVLGAGTNQALTASFTPTDTTNYETASKTVHINVGKAAQAISVTQSAPAAALYGDSFTVSATGGASGNPVAIAGSGACAGGGSGSATLTMTSGTGSCAVTYSQTGDSNHDPASPVTETTVAHAATQAITVTQSAPATAVYGTTFTVGATGGASAQPVVIAGAGACAGGGSGSATLTMTSGMGSCAVTYTQGGDANYDPASPVTETATAETAAQAITFGALPDRSYPGVDFSVSATGGGSGQPVTFTATGACTVTGAVVHLTGVGSCAVTAHQAGDDHYSAAVDVAQGFAITTNPPPETTVTSGPVSPTNQTTATFSFTGTDDVTSAENLTFECKLDGGVFGACTSPATYTNLNEGPHTFAVRAIDAGGNVDPTPAEFSWTIDLTAPAVILDSMPFDPTSQATATFAFHASEANSLLECSLDGAPFAACTSPLTFTGIADGTHTFAVRAADQAGNQGAATTFGWKVDTRAPDTLIHTAPNGITNSNTATFTFDTSDPSDTFECSLSTIDGGAFTLCTSPQTYSGLGDGTYTFQLRVNGFVTASFTWVIDTGAPDTEITAGPASGSTTPDTSATFSFTGSDTVTDLEDLTFECSLDGDTFEPCTSPKTYTGLGRGPHTFTVRARDEAGNVDPNPATRIWTATKMDQTITVTQNAPAFATYDSSFSVSATGGGSGAPVVIAGAGACTGGGHGSATITMASGPGTCLVTYNQAGDGNYSAALPVTQATTAQLAAPSSTVVVSDTNPATSGAPVTFTATVSAVAPGPGIPAAPGVAIPTGAVTFKDGPTTLGSATLSGGQATFSTSSLTTGTHSITVTYEGDATFTTSSADFTLTVKKAKTMASVGSSAHPARYGQSVTLTAAITPVAPGTGTPTGTVTFTEGPTTLGTATLSGGQAAIAISSLTKGWHPITVTYGGDANFKPSTSEFAQKVKKAKTTTTMSSSVNPSSAGQAVTFTATVTAVAPGAGKPKGSVTFMDGATTLGTVTLYGGQATFTTSSLSAGSHSIVAIYEGSAKFRVSFSGALTQTVQ